MKYNIIAIGDELLIGQVTDTNSGWIARHLSPYGWKLQSVQVVADDAVEIKRAIDIAFHQSDVVLMTGGLGPTKDEITKPTLCKYFGGKMVHDDEVARQVEWVVEQRHLKLNDYTRAQAMVPSSCRVIQNEVGTAPLMWFERDGKVLVSMPGVPFETETMMQRKVISQLLCHFNSDAAIEHHTMVVIGIIESLLAMKLDTFERELPGSIHLAYLPQGGYIKLRLTGMSDSADALAREMKVQVNKLHDILGDAIVCDEDKPLSAIVGDILRSKGLTLATAESCTGGNIAHEITSIAGSSDYFVGSVVSYATRVKTDELNVSQADVDEFTVVSEPVAIQMAEGVANLLKTDCSVATTGVAGPTGGDETNPVGTVWIAVHVKGKTRAVRKHYPGERVRVITRATIDSLLMLLEAINS